MALDQRRAFAAARALDGLGHRAAHGQHVHAVHHLAGDAVGAGAVGDVGQLGWPWCHGTDMPYRLFSQMKTTGRFHRLAMLSDSWKLPVLEAPSPKKHSTTRSVSMQLLGQRRADGHGDVAADDAGGAQVAVLHVGDVHRAALALAVAAGLAQHFGHHLVVVLLLGLGRLGMCVAVGVGVAVAAVGAGDQVVVAQGRHGADGHGLLAGVQVRGAFEHGLAQQVGDVVLQRADLHHLAQVTDQLLLGEALFLDHGGDGLQAGGLGGGFGLGGHERILLEYG